MQDDLKYLEASEDKNEEFYGGGGGGAAGGRPLEHFPQLWCPNGTYSAYGQVLLDALQLLTAPVCCSHKSAFENTDR